MRDVVICGTRSFGLAVAKDLSGIGALKVRAIVAPPGDVLASWAMTKYRVEPAVNPVLVEDALVVCAHSHAFIGAKSRAAAWDVIGYHPSLLPRHRGKDAVAWTIRMGDAIAGGSVYRFTGRIDGGPILRQEWCHVKPGWAAGDLWREELFPMGIELLHIVVEDCLDQMDFNGRFVLNAAPQVEAYATWEPSLDTAPLYRPELLELPVGEVGAS